VPDPAGQGDEAVTDPHYVEIHRRPWPEVLVETWDKLVPKLDDLVSRQLDTEDRDDATETLGLVLTMTMAVEELRRR
jgi:hypothetical protein